MNIRKIIKKISGLVYFRDDQIHKGVKILHITDTPQTSFRGIEKLIEDIEPDYIIHTGDMVDNIKLELFPEQLERFKKGFDRLILKLEKIYKEKLFLVVGNHDNLEYISKKIKFATIVKKYKVINIENKKLLITHNLKKISINDSIFDNVDFILYGHDYNDMEYNVDKRYLNGLSSINLLYIETGEVERFEYPLGTDDSRLMKIKIGMWR